MSTPTIQELRDLRAGAEEAREVYGQNSAEHLTAYGLYVHAVNASYRAMIKAAYVELTSS
jgi:hypothetical protein